MRLFNFRFNGALAEAEPATFVAGRIAMRPARNGDTAYGKAGVSVFSQDDSLQEIFSAAPDALVGELSAVHVLEEGLQQIRSYVESLTDKERWDAFCTVMTEVVHIDPRDNGGFIITVGDLDIMSTAGTTDIYVSAAHESLVDFSVGSTVMLVGQPYISRDDEARLITTGWWCAESLGGAVMEATEGLTNAEVGLMAGLNRSRPARRKRLLPPSSTVRSTTVSCSTRSVRLTHPSAWRWWVRRTRRRPGLPATSLSSTPTSALLSLTATTRRRTPWTTWCRPA